MQRKKMEQAIASDFIAWHALPFSWQTELMDPSLISGAIAISHSLDQRFGRKTTGAKMTDVPGHTRGLVSPLAAAGVKFLDIGVNAASTPAVLPPLFRLAGSHRRASSSCLSPRATARFKSSPAPTSPIAIVMADDNAGPHSPEEIAADLSQSAQTFPQRRNPRHRPHATSPTPSSPIAAALPVVTQEIGDTWIHGIGSDPIKVARYREVSSLRNEWIANGKLKSAMPPTSSSSATCLLEAEHTWGTDTKT